MQSIRRRAMLAGIGGSLVIIASVGRSTAGGDGVLAVTPGDIAWSPVSGYPPGYARAMLEGASDKAVPFTYRVRLPAGFKFQPHRHGGDEHVTVLQGTWAFGVGGTFDASHLRSFAAGSFIVIPAGTPHFVAVKSDTIIQVHGIGPIGFQPVAPDKPAVR